MDVVLFEVSGYLRVVRVYGLLGAALSGQPGVMESPQTLEKQSDLHLLIGIIW